MRKTITILLLLIIVASANAQTISAAETVKNYSVAQKRLLVVSTAQFINYISQNNLDQDSVMTMACRITGLPFLLTYTENFRDNTLVGEDIINAGRTGVAVQLLNKLEIAKKIPLMIELGIWYLHQPGTHKSDLDSARIYIDAASRLSSTDKYNNWETECRFLLAELLDQSGDVPECKKNLLQVISSGQQKGNSGTVARAYQYLGNLIPQNDTTKPGYYYKSLELYRQLKLKEKQIELLGNLLICHVDIGFNLAENEAREILSLQQSTGFKHTLYVQNIFAYILNNQTKYLIALEYANVAIENMNWSGIDAVAGTFFSRIGVAYISLGKNQEGLSWLKKALGTRRKETHVFWYKSLIMASQTICFDLNKAGESLSLVAAITKEFPPVTIWEKMQLLIVKGECYVKLNKSKLADKYYMDVIDLKRQYPSADPYGELYGDCIEIAKFYVLQSDLKKARLFLKQAYVSERKDAESSSMKYSLLYKIDSLEGNYRSALQNHIQYKVYYDSSTSIDQRKKMDELTIKYAAEKKEQDIKMLKQQGIVQQGEIKQNKMTRNIMIAGTILLLIIIGLLFSQFKMKQRTNAAMNKKNLALQHLVEEKEWLLKEVHHRVKNNLHTVICLLESQAAYLENDALKAIENSQHRIYAMSLIHQKLYQSDDVKTIDMSVYLPELISYLGDSFGKQEQVLFQLDIEALKLDITQAIPIALIINEAVNNSIKYAFPGNRKGVIEIIMHQVADKITLTIADDGIGIDPGNPNKPSASLGLKLIKGLTEDINGDVSFKNENGTKISIVFNVDPLNDTNSILQPVIQNEVYA